LRLDVRLDRKISPNLSYYLDVVNATAHRNVAEYFYIATYTSRTPVQQMPLVPAAGFEWKFT